MALTSTKLFSNVDDERKKRKKPPTFQFHPEIRAKKLKKEWIEKEKIKAKWRAQKRREGLGNPGSNLLAVQHDQDAELEEEEDKSDMNENIEEKSQPEKQTAHWQEDDRRNIIRISKESHLQKGKHKERNDINSNTKSSTQTDEVSLRELRKKAYSHSSLHTYKSDPLRRRKDMDNISRGGGLTKSRSGQPNMKLRMEAMLEKIKRDIT